MSSALLLKDKCPECMSKFIWSDLIKKKDDLLTLKCFQCKNTYTVPNTDAQERLLSNQYGCPAKTHPLTDVNQLREGDHITFYRKAWIIKYQHHAIVTKVNYKTGTVEVVEFAKHLPLRWGAVTKQTKNFDLDIKPETSFVLRYRPLDCLPPNEVLTNANAYIDNPTKEPSYAMFGYNCQHLAGHCKTGRS